MNGVSIVLKKPFLSYSQLMLRWILIMSYQVQVLHPQLDLLTENQLEDVSNLRQSCQQAEDAVSQGMDKLQYTLSAIIAGEQLGEGNYGPQITNAMDKLVDLVSFVNQVIFVSPNGYPLRAFYCLF